MDQIHQILMHTPNARHFAKQWQLWLIPNLGYSIKGCVPNCQIPQDLQKFASTEILRYFGNFPDLLVKKDFKTL